MQLIVTSNHELFDDSSRFQLPGQVTLAGESSTRPGETRLPSRLGKSSPGPNRSWRDRNGSVRAVAGDATPVTIPKELQEGLDGERV
jgi:hypothetical protein